MPPQPTVDVERKEELILAKQLRACRVNILPRVSSWSSRSRAVMKGRGTVKCWDCWDATRRAGAHQFQLIHT